MTDLLNPDRRTFLAGLATLPLAGCDPKPKVASTRTLADLSEAEGARFVDSDGRPVNVTAMLQSLHGKPSTLSFMYAACGTICPTTALALNRLSANAPSLKHVVVSVDPFGDFQNGNLKQKLMAEGLNPGIGGNTTILYPTTDGTTNQGSLFDGGAMAEKIENKFDLLVNPGRADGHSGAVTLFGSDGQLVAQAYDNSRIVETLAPKLAALKQR